MKDSKSGLARTVKAHFNRGAFYLVLLIGICLIPFALAQRTTWRAPANIITVTNLNDSGSGSLRQALADASDGDTINFALSGTISLTSGELVIDKSVLITGQTQSITVSRALGESDFRIFHVMPDRVVTIEGLYITGGSPTLGSYGGGVLNDHGNLTISDCSLTTNSSTYGGAISSDGSDGNATLAVLNSSITSNYAVFAGGGIYNYTYQGGTATVSLTNSTVSSNTAAYSDIGFAVGDGGGIYNSSGTLTITDSSVSNNLAGVTDPWPAGTGGGIYSDGALTITNSTISGNQSYLAGGGIAGGLLTITSSTVSGNEASSQHDGQPFGQGGGISGSVTLTNSTVSDNSAALSGGGIDGSGAITNSTISGNNGGGISVDGTLEIGNSILNASAPNISNNGGTVTSQGYNVCSDDGGGFLNGPGGPDQYRSPTGPIAR